MTNMVTITEARFVELYRKATETESICHECKDEHTAEEFAALKKERDELQTKLAAAIAGRDARQKERDEEKRKRQNAEKELAFSELCIDRIAGYAFDVRLSYINITERTKDIISEHRKANEAK